MTTADKLVFTGTTMLAIAVPLIIFTSTPLLLTGYMVIQGMMFQGIGLLISME